MLFGRLNTIFFNVFCLVLRWYIGNGIGIGIEKEVDWRDLVGGVMWIENILLLRIYDIEI